MRRSPEALVACLRNRRAHIITYGILSVILVGLLAIQWLTLTGMIARLVPKEGDDLLFHVVLGQQMLVGIACMQTMAFLLALGLGAAVTALIGELTAFTKRDLLVHLWDRVQALEQSQLPPVNSQQPQSRPSADQPGG